MTAKQKTWLKRIRQARKRGSFTVLDMAHAALWNSCAIGEEKPSLGEHWFSKAYNVERLPPKEELSVNRHRDLWKWGMLFSTAVESNNFDKAEEFWRKIHTT